MDAWYEIVRRIAAENRPALSPAVKRAKGSAVISIPLFRNAATAGFAVSFICLMSGCLRPTEVETADASPPGVWHYTAIQSAPVRETIEGSLTFSRSGSTLEGRLDVEIMSTESGVIRVASGAVAGTSSGGVIDFDASLTPTPRRHVGETIAETIQGTWIEASPSGVNASGTFRAERRAK